MGGKRWVQQAEAELHKITVKTLSKSGKQLSQPSPTNLFLTKEWFMALSFPFSQHIIAPFSTYYFLIWLSVIPCSWQGEWKQSAMIKCIYCLSAPLDHSLDSREQGEGGGFLSLFDMTHKTLCNPPLKVHLSRPKLEKIAVCLFTSTKSVKLGSWERNAVLWQMLTECAYNFPTHFE